MGATRAPVDKTTRQDLILRLISERDLGTQQGVVGALGDEGVALGNAVLRLCRGPLSPARISVGARRARASPPAR